MKNIKKFNEVMISAYQLEDIYNDDNLIHVYGSLFEGYLKKDVLESYRKDIIGWIEEIKGIKDGITINKMGENFIYEAGEANSLYLADELACLGIGLGVIYITPWNTWKYSGVPIIKYYPSGYTKEEKEIDTTVLEEYRNTIDKYGIKLFNKEEKHMKKEYAIAKKKHICPPLGFTDPNSRSGFEGIKWGLWELN